MPVSVHIADLGVAAVARLLVKPPRPAPDRGLLSIDSAVAAPLSAKVLPSPQFGRIVVVAFWSSDDALDTFLSDDPLGERLSRGWFTRLVPLRASGSWTGLPADVPRPRVVPHEGPVVVLTLGRTRLTQLRRFLRTSAQAADAATTAPGFMWGTAMARPPFVATCSVWESGDAVNAYAYGQRTAPHSRAIQADREKAFHHQSAFIRLQPTAMSGSLSGLNPLQIGVPVG